MGFKVKPARNLAIFAILLIAVSSETVSNDAQFQTSLENFSQNMFTKLIKAKGQTSIIYSPFAIQTCLAMARMGAAGKTAMEMDSGLGFTGQSVDNVANNYHSILAKYENSDILKIANKIYAMQGHELHEQYNELLSQKFFSSAENIDFNQKEEAANTIDNLVRSKTNNNIKDLVKPAMLSSDTRLLLLSAIYFKGPWKNPFDLEDTEEKDFYTDESSSVKVHMMFKRGHFQYGRIQELNASVVRMPYNSSDLAMVVILPNSRNGLAAMEEKLSRVSLATVSKNLRHYSGVNLHLPRFKTELVIELTDTLKKMGMNEMFSNADFGNMLKSPEPVQISQVVHKAFIEVNEVGTEAAAAAGAGIESRSRFFTFKADHPFYYVIMNEESVPLFQGTFVGI